MSDVDVMARTIYGEARGQSFQGQVAVAFVIKTRSDERRKSITEICLAPMQFSCWNRNDPNRKIVEFVGMDTPRFMTAYGIACLVITGQLVNPAPGANHYHTVSAPDNMPWPPNWAKQMKTITTIGAHTFLRG